MHQRTKDQLLLRRLVSAFEQQQSQGRFDYWDSESFVEIIFHYEEEGDLSQALSVASLALSRYPYQIDFFLEKSRLLTLTHRLDQALATLDEAEAVAPGEPEIRVLRSDILYSAGRFLESLEILTSLREMMIGNDRSYLLIREAKIYESMKDFDQMFDTLKLLLEIDPNNHQALEEIWMSVEHSKRYDDSIALHTALIDRNPYSYLAWFNLGHAYSCRGDYNKAIEALEYAFIIEPEFEAAYMDCAELCFQERRYEQAYEIYEEVNDRFGPDAEILVYMVECLLPLKNYDMARKLLLSALTQDPYNDEVHFYIGECCSAKQRWNEAIKAYNKAIKIDDRREEYLMGIAKAFSATGQKDLALHYFKKATYVAPEQNSYWVEYALYVKKAIGLEACLDILHRAEEYAVGNDLTYLKSVCLLELGLRPQALAVLEEGLSDDFQGMMTMIEADAKLISDPQVVSMCAYFNEEDL